MSLGYEGEHVGFAFILEQAKEPLISKHINADASEECCELIHPSINLDVNVWVDKGESSYIDFGVRIPISAITRQLCIYIPYLIQRDDVIDLSRQFKNDEVAHGIFDSNLTTDYQVCDDVVYLHREDESGGISLACLPVITSASIGEKLGFELNHLDTGSVLIVDLFRASTVLRQKCDYFYYRFRVPFRTFDDTLSKARDYREAITSPFISCTANMFIGINEGRQLPPPVRKLLYREKTAVGDIYIIAAVDNRWTAASTTPPYRVRPLEPMVWRTFFPQLKEDDLLSKRKGTPRYTVYQWFIENGAGLGDGRTFSLTLSKKVVNASSVIFYLVIFLLLNIASEAVTEYVLLALESIGGML